MIDRVIEPLKAAAASAQFEISIRAWRGPLRSAGENKTAAGDGRGRTQPCEAGPPSRNNASVS
jgi:hypothetical protein